MSDINYGEYVNVNEHNEERNSNIYTFTFKNINTTLKDSDWLFLDTKLSIFNKNGYMKKYLKIDNMSSDDIELLKNIIDYFNGEDWHICDKCNENFKRHRKILVCQCSGMIYGIMKWVEYSTSFTNKK